MRGSNKAFFLIFILLTRSFFLNLMAVTPERANFRVFIAHCLTPGRCDFIRLHCFLPKRTQAEAQSNFANSSKGKTLLE